MLFLYFNSRPHEEIDDWLLNTVTNLDISTHDLTRRSTILEEKEKRVWWDFNSRPHEEVDSLLTARLILAVHFNSRPHEEVDFIFCKHVPDCFPFQLTTSRGGRLVGKKGADCYDSISTHDLTRRSTATNDASGNWFVYFNSRPHEEVDTMWARVFQVRLYFNSRPHEEVDWRCIGCRSTN